MQLVHAFIHLALLALVDAAALNDLRSPADVPQYRYEAFLIWSDITEPCLILTTCSRVTCIMTWTFTDGLWPDSLLVYRCRYETVWYECYDMGICDTCWSDEGSGFKGYGRNIYASECGGWCGPPATTTDVNIYCAHQSWFPSASITRQVYTVPDCRTPVQSGIVFYVSGSTDYNSYQRVISCDSNSGYVGSPTVSWVYCNLDANWDFVWGCTDTCDGQYNCWPGECGNGKVSQCTCSPGFQNTADITCEITASPSFENCYIEVTGPSGEIKTSSTGTHQCSSQTNVYGKFNPTSLYYNLMAHFDASADTFPSSTPYYVVHYKFGMSDVFLRVVKLDASDIETEVQSVNLVTDISYSQDVTDTVFYNGNINLNGVRLRERESLCLDFIGKGGGYLKTTETSNLKVYKKTIKTERRCYFYDATPPHHCIETQMYVPCDVDPDPLILESRITKTPNIDVSWQGWVDAFWSHDVEVHHSGIHTYTIIVNEVLPSNTVLKIGTEVIFTKTFSSSETNLVLNLPRSSPKLFCVTLEVKDVADNVGFARRFFLYDETSNISHSPDESKFYFSSATADTKYTWQTHLNDVCTTWKDYFFNQFYMENNLLAEIESDPHGHISDIYEQLEGEIPVSGTQNVHGIISFKFAYAINGSPISSEIDVPNFQSQAHCKELSLMDGDVVTVRIGAIDIVGNDIAANRTVFIDSSAPIIKNVGLVRGGLRMLTVHHETDLSTMDLQLDAYDLHSGIKVVEWEFGESDHETVYIGGALTAKQIAQDECSTLALCYSPEIGNSSEYQRFSISLQGLVSKLKHMGDHNRNYFFIITIINNANLITTQRLDVLVDDSPPQSGIVLEGPIWGYGYYPDIDYTSDESFLVHWYGFLDHESEIKLYRLGLADRCLSAEEVQEMNTSSPDAVFADVNYPENAFEMTANFTGKKFVSVIALNNAMDSSGVVCSDGVSRDIFPPEVSGIKLAHATWSDFIYCHDNVTWLIRSDLIKFQLPYSGSCDCSADSNSMLINSLPVHSDINDNQFVSDILKHTNRTLDVICSMLPLYDGSMKIYLPNDRISLQWDVTNDDSQTEEFLVGFGNTAEEEFSPGLIDYVSTDTKGFFELHHAAIGTGEEFFIFFKAVSKTGLETVVPIGPILIDETPPRINLIPTVLVDDEEIAIVWENNSFIDDQQQEPINRILFQISHDEKVVMPTIEWRLEFSNPCFGFSGGCLKYLLNELQKQDTGLGLSFYVKMHVFNKAGHSVTYKTDSFTLPSMYPPAKTIIYDLDPVLFEDITTPQDTDAHFSAQTICVMWDEFKCHEGMTLELGVGLSPGKDDVYAFSEINNTNKHCLVSTDIPEDMIVFVSVRASDSGGSVISNSDGVIVYNRTNILKMLEVLDGPKCITAEHKIGEADYSDEKLTSLTSSLNEGHVYTLRITANNISKNEIGLQKFGAHVKLVNSKISSDHIDITFQPYDNVHELILPPITNQYTSSGIAEVYDCEDDVTTQTETTRLIAHWRGLSDHFTYEAAAVRVHCAYPLEECVQYLSPYIAVSGDSIQIADLHLEPYENYHIAIRPCLYTTCIGMKLSTGISVELGNGYDRVKMTKPSITYTNTDCSDLSFSWEELYSIPMSFYKWTVAVKAGTSSVNSALLPWHVAENGTLGIWNINECVRIPVHAFKQMHVCVRACTTSGLLADTCHLLSQESETNVYETTVYDLDANLESWDIIVTALHSVYIGDNLIVLHNAEIDIATKDSSITGAVLGGKDREIKWYLMKTPIIPDRCERPNCKASIITYDGYVQFSSSVISYDTVYFICARTNEIDPQSEMLPKIETCSNGFVVDNSQPTGGELHVSAVNGYISNPNDLKVMWYGFRDNADVATLGYDNEIASYTVAIGTSQCGNDIMSYSLDGSFTKHVFNDIAVTSGTDVFVSVTASDHAGFNKSVCSEHLIVDTTPPVAGHISATSVSASGWLGSNHLSVYLKNFYDDESGIDYYTASIGSLRHRTDVIAETNYKSDFIEIDLEDSPLSDGHTYFLAIKAVNMAEISSDHIYLEFSVDLSPPTGGFVMDGKSPDGKDVDFQTDTASISAHWKGFVDPHSGIAYYKVGLGTEPFQYDVEPIVNIGLNREMSWGTTFTPGVTYYATITACSGADLCRTIPSDGILIDNSPPIAGHVYVGSDSFHLTYIPHQSFVEIFWTEFEDPQSGMSHFEACIGSAPYVCDVVPTFDCLLGSSHHKSGIDLAINTELYATVTGYNRNNQSVSKSSRHFMVDNSPPTVLINPYFNTSKLSFNGSQFRQWEKSILNLFWLFDDPESPISRHIITLKTHHEGHTPVEHLELGNENEVTINLDGTNWLHNGDTYTLIVTACNAAGLCSTAKSNSTLLIDTTPPHLGGFRSPVSWVNVIEDDNQTRSRIQLNWYGFYDYESGISNYYIGVGRTFTENELTNGLEELSADSLKTEQSAELHLNEKLSFGDKLVVSVIAENGVGLISPIARLTLTVDASSSSSGSLKAENHSCDIHFCNKDCTCAVVGQVCAQADTNLTCKSFPGTENNSFGVSVRVFVGTYGSPQHVTVSSSCLQAYWIVDDGQSIIKRFEWTLGLKDEPYGEGIFNLSTESPWIDVGKFNYSAFCLPMGKNLHHGAEYVAYLRAWVDMNTYISYQSAPVIVDHTPPSVRAGSFIRDSDEGCTTDYDIVHSTEGICACWDSVFYEAQGKLTYFLVSLGTKPGADDVVEQTNYGLDTRFSTAGLNFITGQKYYFTVISYNDVGLRTVLSSDGFLVDTDGPLTGVVYNTNRNRNYAAQSDLCTFELSWNGFIDNESGVKGYYVALYEDTEVETMVENFTYVSIKTSVTLTNHSLEHNKRYFGAVRAINAGELSSKTVFSESKLVDASPPTAYMCLTLLPLYQTNVEISKSRRLIFPINFEIDAFYLFSGNIDGNKVNQQVKLHLGQTIIISLPVKQSHDGLSSFSYNFQSSLEGVHNVMLEIESIYILNSTVSFHKCNVSELDHTDGGLVVTQLSKDTFKASLRALDRESGIKSTLLGFGSSPGGFQFKSLYPVDPGSDQVVSLSVSHGSKFYATAIAENFAHLKTVFHSPEIIVDHTAPVLENIEVEKEIGLNMSTLDPDAAMMRLNVSWSVKDKESGVNLCFVSVGTTRFIGDLQQYKVANAPRNFQTEWVQVFHGDYIYANIKCVNKIELSAIEAFGPIKVSLQKPSNENARIRFIPQSQHSIEEINAASGMAIQSNTEHLQFGWDGFSDVSGVTFEYKLSSSNVSVTDWVITGLIDTVSVNRSVTDGEIYTVEACAVNSDNLTSDIISADILVHSSSPLLTGQPLTINADYKERLITLDWQTVFELDKDIPAHFEVIIGSAAGFSDVMEELSITTVTFSFPISPTMFLTQKFNELHIVINSVYSTGERASYTTSYSLWF